MQVLAAQYSKLYTRKFRVSYTDFVLDSATRKTAVLFTMPRNWEVIGVKFWLRTKFVAVSMSSCGLYVIKSTTPALASEFSNSPATINGLLTPSDSTVQVGFNSTPGANQSADTAVWLRMVTNTITGGAALTAGSVDVWVITARFP